MTSPHSSSVPPALVQEAPHVPVEFMPVDLDVERREDGTLVLRSRLPLGDYDPNLARAIARRARDKGAATALGWRGDDGGWRTLSYRDFKAQVDAAATWLRQHLPPRSPVLIVAENGPAAALMTVAAFSAGMIAAPVGPSVALVGPPFERLRHVLAKQRPAAAFLDSRPAFAPAAALLREAGITVIAEQPDRLGGGMPLDALRAQTPDPDIEAFIDGLDVDAPAQYMLTSGSTGLPKVVPHSLRMLAANLAQGVASIGRAAGWDQDMLDWLPWHHAAGASVLRACLVLGGTLYIDAGKPLPGLFEASIANLRDRAVCYFNNVPAGFALLADALEADAALRATFFSKLRLMLYGGAGLPQPLYDRLQALAVATTGRRVHMTTGYGMTETVSGCMTIHWPDTRVGIGLPPPALAVKLVPNGARYEVRLKGPSVMAGYLDEPAKNRAAFDDEGFYRTGDLAVFHDPQHPAQGLAFAGRMVEEFKLANGTWVPGGMLREALLKALAGTVRELVLADDGRPVLGMLAWAAPGVSLDAVAQALARFNAGQHGASTRIARVTLLASPPDPARHELSDKGSINRRAVLDNRADVVEALFATPPGPDVRVLPA